ncbi:MAG: hypothetical protein HY427_01755 [Candidatus Levybacteria bacterium]|nr:hypothetical protein [Candidatus Levybacteria bacterium]
MEKDNLVHNFNESEATLTSTPRSNSGQEGVFHKGPIILFLILAVLGVGTGYLLSQTQGTSLIGSPSSPLSKGGGSEKGKTYGSTDEKTFKDSVEGTLREGGIDGEGAYHLERPGGESQNVYLTSSVLDLAQFIGKKVKVWGETHTAEKAGWLMDVGRLQVL